MITVSGIVVVLVLCLVIMNMRTNALQQMAGPIAVKINPGETKNFTWSLLSDENKTGIVTISANGSGAKFFTFPNPVKLLPNTIVNVPFSVTIPTHYDDNSNLKPTIRATQVVQSNGNTALNIEMAKIVSIIIANNTNTTSN
jgi:hypothetical protein